MAHGACAQLPSYVPTTGLQAWYPFNGNAYDMSGNGNHGSTTNTTLTNDRDGIPNAAYSFNGANSYIDCSNFSAVVNVPELTVSAWFLSLGNVSQSRIISKEHYQNNAAGWHIGYSSSNGSELEVNMSTNMAGGGVFDSLSITNGMWYHVAMVFYGPGSTEVERLKMYLNGVEVPLDYYYPIPDFTSTAVHPLWIGNNYGFASVGQWNGTIDDVGIWTTALNPLEIADLYTAQDLNVGMVEEERNAVRIGPNPVRDVLTFMDGPAVSGSVDIYSMLGAKLFTVPFARSIDMSGLKRGMYLLQVNGPDGTEVLRFVKD